MENKFGPRYERVTVTNEGETKSFFLRVTRETETVLAGFEINRDGDEIQPPGADRRLHIIEKKLITKRVKYAMNNTYGMLERVKK